MSQLLIELRSAAIFASWALYRLFIWPRRGYEIVRQAVDPEALDRIRQNMPATPSGIQSAIGQITEDLIAPLRLEPIAARYLGPCKFVPTNSSCRLQLPEHNRALTAHQNAAPLHITWPWDRGITIWVPLVPIDETCASLAVAARESWRPLPHGEDNARYVVLPNSIERLNRIEKLDLGDIVVLRPLTIHATDIPLKATRPRWSLDLRAVPLSR